MTQLAFHRYANIFPLIEGEEFFALAEDIRQQGLRDRIDLIEIDGGLQILDGRNRYRALVWLVTSGELLGPGWNDMAGEALTAEYLADHDNLHIYVIGDEETDGDPLDYVISKNLPRRHLTDDDRRMVAATLVELRQGRPDKTSQFANISRDRAAKLLNTDVAGVDRARSVISRAAPEIVQAAREGKVSVAAAAEIAAQPAERQAQIVAKLPRDADGKLTPEVKKALAPIVKEMRAEKVAAKKERRAEREQDLGRRLQALPDKMFGVAIEDFEWHHEVWSAETGMNKHPANHYETAAEAVTPEQIVARCTERFACLADDCVLFKWTTIPHLAIALKVLELQGFEYVTHLVWNKERSGNARGTGYWFTGEHETVLVGVRGKVVKPATAHFRSNFSTPVGDHSEKPDNLHEIAEFYWPNVPKVEFNARRARPGWKTWGFDAPAEAERAPSDREIFDALAAIEAADDLVTSDTPQFSALLSLGLIWEVAGCPGHYDLTQLGCDRLETGIPASEDDHRQLIDEIANGSSSPSAAEPPAPTADVAPADRGEVVSDAAAHAAAARADTAVSPANRPGANSDDDGLDIPAFLRRTPPIAQTEMDLARIDRAPAEIVDDCLQTRLPLTDDEVELQAGLRAVDEGCEVPWVIVRQLIGAGYAHAGADRISVTDAGRAWLAQLTPVAAALIEADMTDADLALRDCLSALKAGGKADPRVMRQAAHDGYLAVPRGGGLIITDEGNAWLARHGAPPVASPQVGG